MQQVILVIDCRVLKIFLEKEKTTSAHASARIAVANGNVKSRNVKKPSKVKDILKCTAVERRYCNELLQLVNFC